MLELRAANDDDFPRLITDATVADAETLAHIRRITQRMIAAGEVGSWLMIVDGEIVGMIGYHAPPSPEGEVEIGYNVAPARERRGYATLAVAHVIENARTDVRITAIVAETDLANVGSQIVLERNAFTETGRIASDEPSGISIRWRRALG